ncbi:MAG: hypothetical protein UZ17_ACD001000885 [Acidobacteria bacterium OLB17]|nr:MAG: hypothetical protein UZ17_ACD001000885 [Acidobacteria bacterium OLB17]
MKIKDLFVLAAVFAMSAAAFGQARFGDGRLSPEEMNQIRREAREPIEFAKKNPLLAPMSRTKIAVPNGSDLATIPSPYDDPDSFGQNVKFYGSLYAGTVYIYHSCDPQVLLNDLGLTLAADDKCIVHNPPSAPMNQTQVLYDPAWEYTIPKNTVSNTLYILTNNNPALTPRTRTAIQGSTQCFTHLLSRS